MPVVARNRNRGTGHAQARHGVNGDRRLCRLTDKTIPVLGLTFTPNTERLRVQPRMTAAPRGETTFAACGSSQILPLREGALFGGDALATFPRYLSP
jgi:hypothetical protein